MLLLKEVTEIYTEEQGMHCLWLSTTDFYFVQNKLLPTLQGNQFDCVILGNGKHYEIVDTTTQTVYSEGDFVTFHPSNNEHVGSHSDDLYDEWEDNQIERITSKGKFMFEDFPGKWASSIISGFSPDQHLED
ncbi:MAG: hypothetical protein U9O83_06375 [Campylobacterota bacterium]|nr:hypothetical protein [Campylobacterota bacterium]